MNQINTGIISFSVVTANNALFAFAINIITALFILDNTAFGVFSFWLSVMQIFSVIITFGYTGLLLKLKREKFFFDNDIFKNSYYSSACIGTFLFSSLIILLIILGKMSEMLIVVAFIPYVFSEVVRNYLINNYLMENKFSKIVSLSLLVQILRIMMVFLILLFIDNISILYFISLISIASLLGILFYFENPINSIKKILLSDKRFIANSMSLSIFIAEVNYIIRLKLPIIFTGFFFPGELPEMALASIFLTLFTMPIGIFRSAITHYLYSNVESNYRLLGLFLSSLFILLVIMILLFLLINYYQPIIISLLGKEFIGPYEILNNLKYFLFLMCVTGVLSTFLKFFDAEPVTARLNLIAMALFLLIGSTIQLYLDNNLVIEIMTALELTMVSYLFLLFARRIRHRNS